MFAEVIWVSGSSNFFSKEIMRELCVDLPQSLFAEPAVLFSINFVMLTAFLFSIFWHWISNLQLILSALLLIKTVQQFLELTVSLTQLIAFLNCCMLSLLLLIFQVTWNMYSTYIHQVCWGVVLLFKASVYPCCFHKGVVKVILE